MTFIGVAVSDPPPESSAWVRWWIAGGTMSTLPKTSVSVPGYTVWGYSLMMGVMTCTGAGPLAKASPDPGGWAYSLTPSAIDHYYGRPP